MSQANVSNFIINRINVNICSYIMRVAPTYIAVAYFWIKKSKTRK